MSGIETFECIGWHRRGFTLVELMVVIALLAGLAMFSAPAFEQWRVRERVDARSRMLLGAFAFARAEAARLGVRVALCRAGPAGECVRAGQDRGAAGWSDDWAVRAYFGERERVLRRYPGDREVVVAGALHELVFVPPVGQVIGGMRRFELASQSAARSGDDSPDMRDTREARCIRISAGGRARLAAGRCPAAS